MRRAVPALLVALVLLAGCTGPAPTGEDSPARPAQPATTATEPTSVDSPAATPTPVEYVVRPGRIPDEFASVELTIRVVFVEHAGDLGSCYPEVFSGPYRPTLTPLPTPAGECHRSAPVTVDLAAANGTRSLGTFRAPADARGHALVVTDVSATLENGTEVETIKGVGGYEAIRAAESPSGSYGVELGLQPADPDADYDYWLVGERFVPAE